MDLASPIRILDCDASRGWCAPGKSVSPCLTRSRMAGLWNVAWGCRVFAGASVRLQGLRVSDFDWPHDALRIRELSGNTMSLCVLEPIIRQAAIGCGVATEVLDDSWGRGSPLLVWSVTLGATTLQDIYSLRCLSMFLYTLGLLGRTLALVQVFFAKSRLARVVRAPH